MVTDTINNRSSIFQSITGAITKYSDMAFAGGIMLLLFVLLFPIPVSILDLLLAFSITISVIILMTTLFIGKPLELSVFPTLLLITTVLRLSLNIASTRLILSEGHKGSKAAGQVIEAFGSFVMQGNVIIGIIVFMILTLINFIVITKGSGRIAEVAARFSLDAMPGKQMAIDADLSAGLINQDTAKKRRSELEQESTFYGAMDGANKFVRGDAIAGIIITVINLIGGMIIGIIQRDLTFSNAIRTYTILTIGDGLVSQIPSLIVSLAAGLLVSKSGVNGSADKAIFGQLGKYPRALWLTSGVTGFMSLLPGIPFIPFMGLSLSSGFTAYMLPPIIDENDIDIKEEIEPATAAEASETDFSNLIYLDYIKLEIGINLVPLLNSPTGNKLIDQIKALRNQMIKSFGFIIPAVRIQDNLQISSNEYIIKIKEIECAKGSAEAGKLMVMDPKGEHFKIPGQDTKDPAFGLPARWIDENRKQDAIFHNYTVVDASTVITTHLTEIIKDNITELMSYSETQKLIDQIPNEHQKVVKDFIPDPVPVSTLQKILQSLLSEMISIRDLPTIIETVADTIKHTSNLTDIVEAVRTKLARQICYANTSKDGFLHILTLSNEWEQTFNDNFIIEDNHKQLAMPPSKLQEFVNQVKKAYDEQAAKGYVPVLLTSQTVRPYVRTVIERFKPATVIMSQLELHPKVKIKTLGSI